MTNETKWSIDQEHSEIGFKVRHLMIAYVRGSFKVFDASIYTNGKDFKTAEIDLWIDADSIDTGNAKRDEHLKGPDFFDTANHKQIAFSSNGIGPMDEDGNHELWGKLTIRGISHNVRFDVKFGGILSDPWGNERAGFSVTGTIKRGDWGLAWNTIIETNGVMVSEEINIACEIEVVYVGLKDIAMELRPEAAHISE